jgi:hypothetical protein
MRSEAIHAWLRTNGPFAAGVQLLREAGCTDEALLFVLDLGETSVSRKSLTEALQSIHDRVVHATAAVAVPTVVQEPTKAEVAKEDADLVHAHVDRYALRKLTPEQEALRKEATDALRTMSYYRARLETLPSDEDRLRDAGHIVRLDLVAVRAFARLDAWLATGRDPGTDPPKPEPTEEELRKELRSITSALSHVKHGRRVVSPAKLESLKARKAEIKAILDALQP